MPVECDVEIKPVGQERFHAVDKEVMRHAFDIHNMLGRFCDELIYKEELARCCIASGFEVHREVLLRALHQGFVKSYYLDMLVNRGVLYELKAVEMLHNNHQKQLINYLLLSGIRHGKLVNFRPCSVESHFVSTRLGRQDRTAFRLADSTWQGDDEDSYRLRETLCALFTDWGVFLDVNLYRDALLYFLNGSETGVQAVNIDAAGRIVGTQQMCLLKAGTAWHLSAVRQHLVSYQTHMLRLLNHTRLERIHWINLDQHTIILKTLRK